MKLYPDRKHYLALNTTATSQAPSSRRPQLTSVSARPLSAGHTPSPGWSTPSYSRWSASPRSISGLERAVLRSVVRQLAEPCEQGGDGGPVRRTGAAMDQCQPAASVHQEVAAHLVRVVLHTRVGGRQGTAGRLLTAVILQRAVLPHLQPHRDAPRDGSAQAGRGHRAANRLHDYNREVEGAVFYVTMLGVNSNSRYSLAKIE